MADMSLKKVPMPEQKPELRNKNFSEVALGYSEDEARAEAARCLNCKHRPCVEGCPVNVQIPDFIQKIIEGDFEGAYQTIRETNSLPAVCGRVCPQESQCEKLCVRAIKGESVGIGRLERFAADWHMQNRTDSPKKIKENGKKVAVVGGGPAGLTCAGDLRKLGYDVTIFEAFHTAGGVLMYGIPEFRLPKEIVRKEIKSLTDMGVKIRTNSVVGKLYDYEALEKEGFDAVFLGTGAGLPSFMGIEGENLVGVYSANEFLTRINLMKAYLFPEYDTPIFVGKKTAVIGGGNVAMDAARSALRLGAKEAHIVYRRGGDELPARLEEVHHAQEEGVIFDLLTNPVAVLGDEKGWVKALRCVKMELGEPDESGRRRSVPIEGSEFELEMDTVVVAIGQSPNPIIRSFSDGLAFDKKGRIAANEQSGETSKAGVYAGGDAVTGAATVILAMGAGKAAAKSIDEYLSGERK